MCRWPLAGTPTCTNTRPGAPTWFLRLLPKRHSAAAGQKIENMALATAAWFYRKAEVLFAPNPELCALLERSTGRSCFLMPRGVDAEIFNPSKRTRALDDPLQILGFVGRLSVEKNIGLLVKVDEDLVQDQGKIHDCRPRR